MDREEFNRRWTLCQADFVDDPAGAVSEADRLLDDVMRARGYSVATPYDRMADISAAYPQYAGSHREAREILVKEERGIASTEDLRRAFMHYRSLFDEILGGQNEELKRAS
jgi:hypothetical protein